MSSEAKDLSVLTDGGLARDKRYTGEESSLNKLGGLLKRNKSLTVGVILVAVVFFVAIFAPLISPHDPIKQDLAKALAPPIWMQGGDLTHILGTDTVGRDLLSRIIFGIRNSLLVSISAVVVAVTIGLTVGLVSGYFGGIVHTILMRLTDIQMAFPFILLAIAILGAPEMRGEGIILVLALASWPTYARVIRSVVLTEKEMDYVVIARSMGASSLRIIAKYLARNILIPISVLATLDIATMIIYESILGFIGLGVMPPTPTIGNIIGDGRNFLLTAWWIATLPGLAIVAILFSFNLFGDALQGELDPRLRQR